MVDTFCKTFICNNFNNFVSYFDNKNIDKLTTKSNNIGSCLLLCVNEMLKALQMNKIKIWITSTSENNDQYCQLKIDLSPLVPNKSDLELTFNLATRRCVRARWLSLNVDAGQMKAETEMIMTAV